MPWMRVVTVVLAAGEGRRMGGPKALLPLGAGTFLSRACEVFGAAGTTVVAVLGAEAGRVREQARIPPGIAIAVNERWSEGMLTSVWAGLDAAEALGADAVLVHPVDNPLVGPGTIAAVLAALAAGAEIAVPSHGGRRGHPAGFARSVFADLRRAPLDAGARSVLAARPDRVVHVPAGPDCLADVDTPGDLEAAKTARLAGARGI
jgi:CTP:molybdopterin cytidylyltransferase MocA